MAQWLTGDPRWASVIAVAAAVLLVAAPWLRVPRPQASVRLGAALLLAAGPAFGVVTYFAWVEPLALPFLVVAGRFWRSRPVVSAIALGLALATKQYFVLAPPLLLLRPDEFRWRRVAIVAGTVLATALPFLIWDPGALWDAVVALHLGSLPRPDSVNLVHLGIEVPRWLVVGVPIGLGVWFGRRGGEGYRFMLALAAVLGALFLLGVQAFQNYWYLVASMALIALVDRYNPIATAELATTPAASTSDQPPS